MAEEQRPIADWLAWLDGQRMMTGWCIAYREDGRVCRAPATILDRQRHGLVCTAYAPAAADDADTGQES